MKASRMMKVGAVVVSVTLAGSVCMAGDCGWGRGEYRGDGRDGGRSYHGYHDGGRHYGYYHNPRGELVFGLLGIGVAAAVISSMNRTETVVVQRPVYVQPDPPRVVYVQQPVVVEQPLTVTVNVQNSNGSFTPVTLRQIGAQWVGPRGEYYDAVPSVGQLRPAYGF